MSLKSSTKQHLGSDGVEGCTYQAECDWRGKVIFHCSVSAAQLTDMQISLIISSSKINYILQRLQYVVSGKITFNIFKLIDVSLEKT